MAQLHENGRLAWLDEEMAVLTSPETYRADPENAWRRLVGRLRKPREIAVLMEVAAWREREAQGRDVPRGRVLKDDAVVDVAVSAPRSVEGLGRLRSIPSGFERSRTAADILEAVERGLARDPKTVPVPERSRRGASRGCGGRAAQGAAQGDRGAGGRRAQDHRHRGGARSHRRERRAPTCPRCTAGAVRSSARRRSRSRPARSASPSAGAASSSARCLRQKRKRASFWGSQSPLPSCPALGRASTPWPPLRRERRHGRARP